MYPQCIFVCSIYNNTTSIKECSFSNSSIYISGLEKTADKKDLLMHVMLCV